VVSDLPLKGKKRERRPTHSRSLTQRWKRSAKKRGKKKRIDSQNVTYIEERKRKRERERKRVFFKRKERHFSSFLSLLSLSSPEGGAS
jgi:hypothetical protein